MASSLVLEALYCERGERLLFSNLNVELSAGEGIRIAGANGSGKTSLLRAVAGISDLYQGCIRWNGQDIRNLRQRYTANLLYLGHNPAVKSSLTPLENLRWWVKLHNISCSDETIVQSLDNVELATFADTPCMYLSAGQLRRVALARLFAGVQRLWILDEPYTALDVEGIDRIEARFTQHLNDGGMIIITTHQPIRNARFSTCDLDQLYSKINHVG